MQPFKKVTVIIAALVVLALTVAACGGGSSSSSSSPSETSTEAETTSEENSGGEKEAEGGDAALIAEAEEELAEFIGQPSEFPVTEKLKEIPKGAKVAMLVNGAPTGEFTGMEIGKAAEAMGVSVTPIKAGNSASTMSNAADTAVAMDPDALIVLGVPGEIISKQIKELSSNGVPIIGGGQLNGEEYGMNEVLFAEPYAEKSGTLMGTYVATKLGEPEPNVVLFTVPELEFTKLTADAIKSQIQALCPTCEVQEEAMTEEEVGTEAPNHVVSYLQAHPEVNTTIYVAGEFENGVPSALEKAGIEVNSLSFGGAPTNLQYVKEGKSAGLLAVDAAVSSWQLMDQTAREIIGQPLTGPQGEGQTDMQFLTKKDITFDPTNGWIGYPEFEERFEELWGLK